MNKEENYYISKYQLFFVLFTVRQYSLLLDLGSITDYAVYFTLSFILCLVAQRIKNKTYESKTAMALLGAVSVLLVVQTVITYVTFTAKAVHPDFSSVLLVFLIAAAVIYASACKIEPIARFSSAVGTVLIIAVFIAIATNIRLFRPTYIEGADFVFRSDFYKLLKCLDLPVLYLILSKHVKSNSYAALKYSLFVSYSLSGIFLLFIFCITGNAISYYEYPSFIVFKLARIGALTRLDIIFTGSVLAGLFLKCSVLLSAAIEAIKGDLYEKNRPDN